MLPRDIIIVIALISLVVGASATIVNQMKEQYPELAGATSSNFTATYYKLAQADLLSKQTYNKTIAGEEATTITGEIAIRGIWAAILLPFRSIGILATMINDAGTQLMIPVFILTVITVIMTTIVIFVVVGAIFKRRL